MICALCTPFDLWHLHDGMTNHSRAVIQRYRGRVAVKHTQGTIMSSEGLELVSCEEKGDKGGRTPPLVLEIRFHG
jgi:hypothetical protein